MKQLVVVIILSVLSINLLQAQQTENFDGSTFSLTTNSYYKNITTDNWSVSGINPFANFRYHWDTAYGGYWKSGFAYTNIKDSVHGDFSNLYGSITNGAFNGNNYVTAQSGGVIKMNQPYYSLSGFFVTNSTYAYKVMKNGNFAARKFGDTTGTHSGLAQGTYPDWFKLIVRPYKNGLLLNDSVQFYLADYRPNGTTSDYIVKNWLYVNCTSLPPSDSILVTLKSSDNHPVYGMNTPGFFCMDNISVVSTEGIQELESVFNTQVYPNPTQENTYLQFIAISETALFINVYDIAGKLVYSKDILTQLGSNNIMLPTHQLETGVYFISLKQGAYTKQLKFVKF